MVPLLIEAKLTRWLMKYGWFLNRDVQLRGLLRVMRFRGKRPAQDVSADAVE
jgi:hypothetical protein